MVDVASAKSSGAIEELPRTAPWIANFDTTACHLIGQFGTGKAAVNIRLTRYAPMDSFDLSLFGERFRRLDLYVRGGVSFDPAAKIAKSDNLAGNVGKLPMVIMGKTRLDNWRAATETDVPPVIAPATEAAVTSMDFEIGNSKRVRLLTGSMGKAMATMRSCMDGLIKTWGFDPAVEANLSRPLQPLRSPATWLVSSDYPVGALSQGHSGIVHFRADVDPSGKVESCHVLSATKPSDFELATCRGITKRARFAPALDAKGQPVRSFHVNTVRWLAGL
jgi:TonB family protein